MLNIYTSHFRYSGPDRLDITYKANTVFSPIKSLVNAYKYHNMSEKEYTEHYYQQMRISYVQRKNEWHEILNRKNIVLVCYCPANTFCHRYLLADILVELGAKYLGEIKP